MSRTRDQLATSGSVDEFDYYRRMIRGLWAFSSLSVAVGGAKTLHDRRACEREIDTHSPSSMECAISIVPPRERTDPIRVRVTHCVHKAPLLHLTKCATLLIGHVRHVLELRDVPHVSVLWRDIEVAQDDDVVFRLRNLIELDPQLMEPGKLVVIELRVDRAAVRYVDADHARAGTVRLHDSALVERPRILTNEPGSRVVQPNLGDDGDAVPSSVAMVHRLVPERVEGDRRKSGICTLRLLQHQHVWCVLGNPALDPRKSRLQRVDVPGRTFHCLGLDEHKQQPSLTGDLTAYCSYSVARTGTSGKAVDVHLERQLVTRFNLATKARAIDPPEEGKATFEALIREHCCGAELRERLHHQNTRDRRSSREVAGKKVLVTAQTPYPAR